jgi:hypothetical protein
MMEFFSWDDYIPNINMESQSKFHGSKPPTRYILPLLTMINHDQRKWDSADLFKTQICGLNTRGFTNLQSGSHLQSQHAS